MYRGGRKPGAKDVKPRKSTPWTPERRIAAGAELRSCLVCGAEFWVSRSQREKVKGGGKFCSRDCRYEGSTAHQQRRGSIVTRHSTGYLLEWAPEHPRASHGRVLQHILIAEAVRGRPLSDDEEVHHRNGRPDDNWPDNLEVVKRGEHQRNHWQDPVFRSRIVAASRANAKRRARKGGRFA